MAEACPHFEASTEAKPRAEKCEDCGATFNLRICTSCGYVGCCESQNSHDAVHAKNEDHPVIRAMTRIGTGFLWCYDCGRYI